MISSRKKDTSPKWGRSSPPHQAVPTFSTQVVFSTRTISTVRTFLDFPKDFNLQFAKSRLRNRATCHAGTGIALILPIYPKILFVSLLFHPQSCWSRTPTFIPLCFFNKTHWTWCSGSKYAWPHHITCTPLNKKS